MPFDNNVTAITNAVYSSIIYEGLHEASQAIQFLNRQYEGEAQLAKTVKVASPSAVTIQTYTGGDLQIFGDTPTSQDIVIDQAKAFTIILDEVQELHTKPKTEQLQLPQAIKDMAENIDTAVWAYMYANALLDIDASDAPTAGANNAGIVLVSDTPNAGSEMTPSQVLARLARKMNIAKIPATDRCAIVDPIFVEVACNELSGNSKSGIDPIALEAIKNGRVGRLFGIDIAMSTLLAHAANIRHCLGFHKSACAFAYALNKISRIPEMELKFAALIKGLVVYGIKMLGASRAFDIKISEV